VNTMRFVIRRERLAVAFREWSPFEWGHVLCPIVHRRCPCMDGALL
jgi:hypothetical protein